MGDSDTFHDPIVPNPVRLLGIPIHPVSPDQLIELIVAFGIGEQQRRVLNVNVHAMNWARRDAAFKHELQNADVVFCDGFGVKWGARLKGLHIPHRMTPPDWIDAFAESSGEAKQPVFALGDEEGISQRFQSALHRRHAQYLDAGSHHGFFRKTGPENDAVVSRINASGATHLLVGFGMPLQEHWIENNAKRLNVKVLMPVGALFRWYIGSERRAPYWMTDNGLEWLGRLLRHPIRHFHRYAVGNPQFLWRVLWSKEP